MAEDIVTLQGSVKELPGNVVEYSTTFGRPRFIGVPRDDQLNEKSSMEGILHGRLISEVYAQDTKELEEAGVDWEKGVHVLKCLAVASAYHETVIDQEYERLRQRIYQGQTQWEVDENTRELFMREANTAKKRHSRLVDFNGKVSAFSTGSRVQVDNPIKDTEPQGDGIPFDLVAWEAPERDIIFNGTDSQFTTTINAQTLLQAEAYHLLEKGNRYALTGAQLAQLVDSFNEDVFFQQIKDWFDPEEEKIMAGLKVVLGHREEIKFKDGVEVSHKMVRGGTLDFFLSKKPFSRLTIRQDNGQIVEISLSGEDYKNAVSIGVEGGGFYQRVYQDSGGEPEKRSIVQGDPLFDITRTAQLLHQTAKGHSDGVLSSNSQKVHELATKVTAIVNPQV